MKLGIIIETNQPEKAWNGVRFGNAALQKGHEVKLFLMSEGVEIEGLDKEPYDAKSQLATFVEQGGDLLACGTCITSRQQADGMCPISTMFDCVEMVEWADKTVTF